MSEDILLSSKSIQVPGFTIHSKMTIPETIKITLKNQEFKGCFSESKNMDFKEK